MVQILAQLGSSTKAQSFDISNFLEEVNLVITLSCLSQWKQEPWQSHGWLHKIIDLFKGMDYNSLGFLD